MAGGVDGVAESSVNFEVHCYSRATSAVFRLYHDSLGLIVASFPFVSSPLFSIFWTDEMHLCKHLLTFAAALTFSCPASGWSQSQLVRFDSNFGKFDIELLQNTPLTNANFLNYVDAGDYTGTFLHRHAVNFVLQGGGFNFENGQFGSVNQNPPVLNEPFNSNIRGTVAMAKLGGDPDSATNQWFFNLENNSENLDNQNGGFTAFAQVVGDGMEVLDAVRNVPIFNASSITPAFDTLPLQNFANDGTPLAQENLLFFRQIAQVTNALGDLDGSGAISGPDVDLLYAAYGAIPANDLELDLDSDGEVGDSDRDRLIERIAGTRLGDLNFDGSVNVLGDAFALVDSLGAATEVTYARGDINGDGAVNVLGDAFILINNLGFMAAGSP